MDGNEVLTEGLTDSLPDSNGLTDEEAAELDAARKAAWEKELEPYTKAAQQRKENTEVIAEHDELLSDILFEMTMNEMGEEV